MIREIGIITAIEDQTVQISTQLKSGCTGCSQRSTCGAGLLSKAFPNRRGQFSVKTKDSFVPGQQVELQLPESTITRFSIFIYILPLLALVIGASIGSILFPATEGPSIALAGAFFAFSFFLLRKIFLRKELKIQALLKINSLPIND